MKGRSTPNDNKNLGENGKVSPRVFEAKSEIIAKCFKNYINGKQKINVPNNTISDDNKDRGTKWATLTYTAGGVEGVLP
jgi:hypothetical protein